jgi:hypothetical protein
MSHKTAAGPMNRRLLSIFVAFLALSLARAHHPARADEPMIPLPEAILLGLTSATVACTSKHEACASHADLRDETQGRRLSDANPAGRCSDPLSSPR